MYQSKKVYIKLWNAVKQNQIFWYINKVKVLLLSTIVDITHKCCQFTLTSIDPEHYFNIKLN